MLVSFLAPLLTGCLELEQTIVLRADGSGSQSLRLGMGQVVLDRVRRAQPALQPLGGADPMQVFEKEVVAAELSEAGLALAGFESYRDARQHRFVELEATFASFEQLTRSPLCGPAAEWSLRKGPVEGTVELTLWPQGKAAWEEARRRAAALDVEGDPVARSFFEKRKATLEGLDVALRLELPGKVYVWTRNLDKTAENVVTARITADQIRTPEDLLRRLAPRFQVIFDGRGCTLPVE